jgi:hypothetical protein
MDIARRAALETCVVVSGVGWLSDVRASMPVCVCICHTYAYTYGRCGGEVFHSMYATYAYAYL